jgi:transposase InsO family protein
MASDGYIESFNGKLRDELLNREIFTTLEEAKVLIEQWRREYNQVRPHSARDNHPSALEAILIMATIYEMEKLSGAVVQLSGAGHIKSPLKH